MLLTRFRFPIVIAFHLVSIVVAFLGSFYIRFDFNIPHEYLLVFYSTLPLILICRLLSYYYYKTFSASWRFTYLPDLIAALKAVLLGTAMFITLLVFLEKLHGFPRSIILLEALLSTSIISGTKLFLRYLNEYSKKITQKVTKNVLIMGGGRTGVLLLNEIRSNKSLGINTVGFVDDNDYLKGRYIQGVKVLGNSDDIPELIKRFNVDEVMIALPSSGYKDIVRITDIVKNAGARIKVLPSLGKLIRDGSNAVGLKNVSTDDLLGRRVIKFCRTSDRLLMEEEIKGKAVLVTGAGGSIGSELCRQIALFSPRIMVMYERYETSLYEMELEMKKDFPELTILPVLGDILDAGKLNVIMRSNRIDLIYHAAAYKHVPMMEREPIEAVQNNVFGTMNIAELALTNSVSKFVLISTDKAVNPSNVMGTTKRVAELVIQSLNGSGTKFVAVRFGNVIGSNGSAIPIFKKQIAEGGPITITHSDMTRYFMSIAEAVQLVMSAGEMGKGGEIFLLDMGEPLKIIDIAKELIRLSGLEPQKDIEITFTGIRPGEKLHEELYWQGEGIIQTDNQKITMLRPNGPVNKDIFTKIKALRESSLKKDPKAVIKILKEIVPESVIT